MTGEQLYQMLTDDTGGTQNPGPQLFLSTPYRRALIAPYCGVFYAPPGRFR